MIICKICNEEQKSLKSLSLHLNKKHLDITKEDYFIKYMSRDNEHICPVCKGPNKFFGLTKRYSQTCSKKCKNHNPKYREKIKKTNLERYGSISPFGSKEVREKSKLTNLERHGVSNVFSSKIIQEKIKETIRKNYGVDNPSKSNLIKEKKKRTTFNNFGVEHHMHVNDIKGKVIESCKKTMKQDFFNKLINSKKYNTIIKPLFKIEEYNGINNIYKFKCLKCNSEFKSNITMGKIPRCTKCFPITSGKSLKEFEILNFLNEYNIKYIHSDKSIINPYELDIYIPEKNLAIEFNGIYWHSEQKGKDKNYHLNKTNLCNEKNIQLIHIFEDEWIEKELIVKSILLNKLGLIKNKIYARKCEIKEVSPKDSKYFLDNNHIQGSINSKYNIGLYYNDDLVSLLTVGNSRFNNNYDYELHRFCNKLNTNVTGGFSKLLKHFRKNNVGSIITYADLRYGTGDVYLKNGFNFLHRSSPNYFYFKLSEYKRHSRNKFQKHKLKNLLENFDETLTEYQNMQMNNYDRIWDCGNNVFITN